MLPRNPLDAVLSEVLGDDGGLILAGNWPDEDDAPAEARRDGDQEKLVLA